MPLILIELLSMGDFRLTRFSTFGAKTCDAPFLTSDKLVCDSCQINTNGYIIFIVCELKIMFTLGTFLHPEVNFWCRPNIHIVFSLYYYLIEIPVVVQKCFENCDQLDLTYL